MNLLKHLPNAITIIRLLLVLPIAYLILENRFLPALVLFAMAGLSDGLDGFLARRYGWVTTFGRLIDPLADKLMMMTTTLALGLTGHFPLMLMILVLAKDLAILGGVFSYTTLAGFPTIRPTLLGKVTTASQIVLLVSVLVELAGPGLLAGLLFKDWFTAGCWIVTILTIGDGISYLWIWTTRLARDPRWKEIIT